MFFSERPYEDIVIIGFAGAVFSFIFLGIFLCIVDIIYNQGENEEFERLV